MTNELSGSRRYLLCFLALVLTSMAILVATAIYVEPLEGELTRIGGYAERDFGGNLPRKALADAGALSHSYDKYYDVVVLGDSFSKPGLWQSFLKQTTGLSFTTLHWDNTSLNDVLNHAVFKQAPPKLVIVESGSRYLPIRFVGQNTTCDTKRVTENQRFSNIQFMETQVDFSDITRSTKTSIAEINLKFALMFLEKSALRLLLDNDFSKVKKYVLTRENLFSSKNSRELLVMRTWFEQRAWTKAELSASACGVLDAQLRTQANGKTLFMLLPIPDKATAYAKYIEQGDFVSMAGINQMLVESKINFARLDILLQNALDNGEKDVYLPNDTHFGTRGYELVAKSVEDLLRAGVYWGSIQ